MLADVKSMLWAAVCLGIVVIFIGHGCRSRVERFQQRRQENQQKRREYFENRETIFEKWQNRKRHAEQFNVRPFKLR